MQNELYPRLRALRNEIYPCLRAIEFMKNIIGGIHNVTIDTNIYYININDGEYNLYHHEDIYTIHAGQKNKITFCKIMKLFEHMDEQFEAILDCDLDFEEYIYLSDFKYNKRKNIYEVKLKNYDELNRPYTYGIYNCIDTLEFIQKVIGLKNDVMFNSEIYSHVLDCSEEDNLDRRDDLYILFGNANKKITLDDVYDLFKDMELQFDIINEKKISRSFYFEAIKIDNNKKSLTYKIFWDS